MINPMEFNAKHAAGLVGGKLFGSENIKLNGIAKIEEAKNGDLTFVYLPAYEKFIDTTQASAILVKPGIEKVRSDLTYIEVSDPKTAFQIIISKFFKPVFPLEGIDASASIHESAVIGENVAIGKNVVISAGCVIGSNSKIFHNSVIMDNVKIGENALLFPNVSIRENCEIGNNCIIHSGAVIGTDGFGYAPDSEGIYQKIPQIGNVLIEDEVEIGSNTTIDRAAMGSTIIKKGVKIDNLVQIAHNVSIGENSAISAQSGVSGSAKVGKNCILAGQVGLVGHLELADNVIVAAQSGVSKSILKPGIYFGSPAKELSVSKKLEAHFRSLPKYAEKIKALEDKIKLLEDNKIAKED